MNERTIHVFNYLSPKDKPWQYINMKCLWLFLICLMACGPLSTQKQHHDNHCQLSDNQEKNLIHLNQLIESDSQNAELYYQRSILYPFNCFAEEKLKDINLAIKHAPAQANYYLFKGQLYLKDSHYYDLERALNLFNQGLLIEPENINLLFERGNIYREKKECEKAILDFKMACQLKLAIACKETCS